MSSNRKDDHLAIAAHQQELIATSHSHNEWDDVRLLHHSLAGIDPDQVSLETDLSHQGKSLAVWDLPFYINGMTGGSELTGKVNAALAEAAAETGIAIATGSMSMFLKDPDTLPTFRVLREKNPRGFVMANLSADANSDQVRRVVDAMEADALQIHINSVQETVMPEGSCYFSSWLHNIESIVNSLSEYRSSSGKPVPVIVKEVGFGMSRETLLHLRDCGVQLADLSGRGGTNFALIENSRRETGDYAFLGDFGQSAPASLLDAYSLSEEEYASLPSLLASGGVRHPYDVVRGLALGAQAVGVAGSFLHTVLEHSDSSVTGGESSAVSSRPQVAEDGAQRLSARIELWSQQLRELLSMFGVRTPHGLRYNDLIIKGSLANMATLRGADLSSLACRSRLNRGGSA